LKWLGLHSSYNFNKFMMPYAQWFPAGVTVGFQQSEITVNENGVAHICAVIKCGSVRRDVKVNLFTEDGAATGML